MNNEYYEKNSNKISFKSFFILDLLTFFAYIGIVVSALIPFLPINELSWFKIGMGKYVGVAVIFSIYFLYIKNYFASFFISLFSSFFAIHELIIFFDNYAIELGKELGNDGVYRFIPDIFVKICDYRYGVFWAILCSLLSLIFVTINWIRFTRQTNLEAV